MNIKWAELADVVGRERKIYLTVMRARGTDEDEVIPFTILARSSLSRMRIPANLPYKGVYPPDAQKDFATVVFQTAPIPYPNLAYKISLTNPGPEKSLQVKFSNQ